MKITTASNKNKKMKISKKEWKNIGIKTGWTKKYAEENAPPIKDKYFHFKEAQIEIGEKWMDSFLVTYPTSYRYNGGIVLDENGNMTYDENGKWYRGIIVPPVKIPEGFEMVSIGVGLNLNAVPPRATRFLKPLDPDREVSEQELQQILEG